MLYQCKQSKGRLTRTMAGNGNCRRWGSFKYCNEQEANGTPEKQFGHRLGFFNMASLPSTTS